MKVAKVEDEDKNEDEVKKYPEAPGTRGIYRYVTPVDTHELRITKALSSCQKIEIIPKLSGVKVHSSFRRRATKVHRGFSDASKHSRMKIKIERSRLVSDRERTWRPEKSSTEFFHHSNKQTTVCPAKCSLRWVERSPRSLHFIVI